MSEAIDSIIKGRSSLHITNNIKVTIMLEIKLITYRHYP